MANGFINYEKQKNDRIINIIFGLMGVLILAYISARGSYYVAENPETSVAMAPLMTIDTISTMPLAIRFDKTFLTIFVFYFMIAGFIFYTAWSTRSMNKHYKDYEQCGTASWQTPKTIKQFNRQYNEPFGKPIADSPMNTIYSKHCQLTMDTGHTNLNNNAMIIGGPGSGKSFNIVRPNLLQKYGSYVVTDPSGELLSTTGKFFEENGYKLKVFNLVDMQHSDCYNPFVYIRGEEDVLTLIQCLMNSTTEGKKSGDPFWEKSETALLEAIIFYLIRWQKPERQNFTMVSNLLRKAKINPQTASSQLDQMFNEVRKNHPDDICVKQYDIFKQASEKTAQSILITAAVRLAPFNIRAVEDLTRKDDMSLQTIGDEDTIIYIIVPQGDNPYAFLVNMLYSQMFNTLYQHAATECEGMRLKNDVRFILDEFANIGVIPSFQVKLTTMRKYGLSCMIFIQATAQIKNLYKDDWETLVGACDTYVYLGGNELSSMEDLTKKLGDQTIRVRDTSSSRSAKGGSDSRSYKYTKRALLTIDEIRRLKKGYCIVLIKGENPFYDEKYKTFDHPNAKYLGNAKKGIRLYEIEACNTQFKAANRASEQAKESLEAEKKRSNETRDPNKKMIREHAVKPAGPMNEAEMTKVMAQSELQLATETAPISVNQSKSGIRGGVSINFVNGMGVIHAAYEQNASASTMTPKKPIAPSAQTKTLDETTDMYANMNDL